MDANTRCGFKNSTYQFETHMCCDRINLINSEGRRNRTGGYIAEKTGEEECKQLVIEFEGGEE